PRRRARATPLVEWSPGPVGRTEAAVWRDAEERECGNLRAALEWMVDAGEAEPALTLADSLAWFWAVRGDRAEGRGWLTRLLALPAARARTAARARELRHLANLCHQVGDAAGRDRAYGE